MTNEQMVDLIFKAVILTGCIGVAIFALKKWLTERTKRRSAGNQLITWDELSPHCNEQYEDIMEKTEKELNHAVEKIETHLKHGEKKFEKMDQTLTDFGEKLLEQSKAFVRLETLIDKKLK